MQVLKKEIENCLIITERILTEMKCLAEFSHLNSFLQKNISNLFDNLRGKTFDKIYTLNSRFNLVTKNDFYTDKTENTV
jgi:hypothetical protein